MALLFRNFHRVCATEEGAYMYACVCVCVRFRVLVKGEMHGHLRQRLSGNDIVGGATLERNEMLND